jgi:hypothetical protein
VVDVIEKAKIAGFKVYAKKVEYTLLTGGSTVETRIVGYHENAEAKLSYAETSSSKGTLYITISGGRANRSMADKIESLGGKVDLEEGKRLFAVFKGVSREEAGDIIDKLFNRKTT